MTEMLWNNKMHQQCIKKDRKGSKRTAITGMHWNNKEASAMYKEG